MPLTPTEHAGLDPADTPPHGQPAVGLTARDPAAREGSDGGGPPAGTRARTAPERVRVTRGHAAADPNRPGARGPRGAVFQANGRMCARLSRRGRFVLFLLAVVVLLAGAVGWYEAEANPFGAPGGTVVVTVRHGEAVGTVLSQLTRDGVVASSFAFRLWSVIHGSPLVLPGRYLFRKNLPFSEVARLLDAGPNVVQLDVAPGTTIAETVGHLSSVSHSLASSFAAEAHHGAVHSPFEAAPGASLEGLLGGGVYEVLPGEKAHTLLAQMVARFDAQAAAAGFTPSSSVDGLTAYQLVVVASIAQKEGYFTRYMGDVARVIYNRLAQGMHLDMTSTVLYSLGQDGGPVTPAQEEITTPYNTYLHPGLTPTPICVPSTAALRAAAAPPAGPWLYFELVTAKNGKMVFSATFTGQLRAEQEAAANNR